MKNKSLLKFMLVLFALTVSHSAYSIDQQIPANLNVSTPPPLAVSDSTASEKIKTITQDQIAAYYDRQLIDAIHKYWISKYIHAPEFLLCCALLLFAFFLFTSYIFLFKNGRISFYQITRLNLLTLIIIGTLFLIIAGYDKEQILTAMTLFGTIAGYLLGKSPTSNSDTVNPQDNNPPTESLSINVASQKEIQQRPTPIPPTKPDPTPPPKPKPPITPHDTISPDKLPDE